MARQRSSTRDDFDRIKDTVHKLKSENRKLRKENSTLRKQLLRAGDIELEQTLEAENELNFDDLIKLSEEATDQQYCPKCRTDNVKVIPAGLFTIRFCTCGYRKRTLTRDPDDGQTNSRR